MQPRLQVFLEQFWVLPAWQEFQGGLRQTLAANRLGCHLLRYRRSFSKSVAGSFNLLGPRGGPCTFGDDLMGNRPQRRRSLTEKARVDVELPDVLSIKEFKPHAGGKISAGGVRMRAIEAEDFIPAVVHVFRRLSMDRRSSSFAAHRRQCPTVPAV